jgi:mannose-1-phosphate guanylyltransferase
MKALVLAAGYGSRLRPLTDHLPKPLAPVLNRPVLVHVLERLRDAGITEIAINTHWHGDLIQSHIGSGEQYGVRVTWFPERELAGSAATMRAGRDYFGSEPVLVTCADVLSTCNVEGLIAQHASRRPAVTVAAAPVPSSWAGDRLTLSDEVTVSGYRSKPDGCEWRLGSFGMWVMEPWLIEQLPASATDFTSEVLPDLPGIVAVEAFDGGAIKLSDVGELLTYYVANVRALAGVFPLRSSGHDLVPGVRGPADFGAPAARKITCEGRVLIGAASTIEADVRLIGPTIIGTGAFVGANSTVTDSVLLPGAYVPPGTLVSGAVFGAPAEVMRWLER